MDFVSGVKSNVFPDTLLELTWSEQEIATKIKLWLIFPLTKLFPETKPLKELDFVLILKELDLF